MKLIRSIRLQFYFFWLLAALVQAKTTELFDDEAYYWVYAQFLDWGYFDHPPMIALLIKLGSSLFSGELGVRFVVVLIGALTIYLIEKLTHPHNLKLFYAIVLNIAVLQIGGIIAVPDIPLLFFTALFFLVYKSYTETPNWHNTFCLSMVIALLLYSKYHGILIIIATLCSNISVLKQSKTWVVIVLSLCLFLPHVIWQVQHGMPSLNYHLFERVSPPYSFSFTTDYLVGQLLIAGPLLGWLMIWSAFKYKVEDQTQKAMKWSMVIVYLIFLLSSFKSRTEANWTVSLLVPIIVLAYHYLESNERLNQWVFRVLPVSFVLILLVRIFMALDEPVIKNLPKDEFHYNHEWTNTIKQKANGLPVVFTNSYQRASKYWFYTGDTSFSLNTYRYRRSNYNFWHLENRLQDKNVFLVGSAAAVNLKNEFFVGSQFFKADTLNNFSSYSQIVLNQPIKQIHPSAKKVDLYLEVNAPSLAVLENALKDQPEVVLIVYPANHQLPLLLPTGGKLVASKDNKLHINFELPDLNEKNYQIRWGLKGTYAEPTINSSVYSLVNDQN
ncbi:MAG: hypothetical protein RL642_439 [Bacteroidota bacterium]|jgi:hypothetical protein